MPGGSTRQAKDIHSLYVFILILALAVFFAVEFAIVWSVLRYRRRPGDDELPKQTHGHFGVEILWTAIPTVIVATLFILSLRTLDRVDAKEAAPSETIEVTGFQWQWTFKYPAEGVVIRGSTEKPPEMVLPVNEPIRIKEKSADVIHSFYVPNFNFKRDVIPGYENSFDFTPTETRVFRDNPRLSKVVVTTHEGTRTVRVYSTTGEEKELNKSDSRDVLEETADVIVDAAGFVAEKTVDAAKATKEGAKKAGEKTAEGAKKVGEKTGEGAKKAGKAIKKAVTP